MSADVNYCSYKTTVIISYLLFQNPCLLKYIYIFLIYLVSMVTEKKKQRQRRRGRGGKKVREKEREVFHPLSKWLQWSRLCQAKAWNLDLFQGFPHEHKSQKHLDHPLQLSPVSQQEDANEAARTRTSIYLGYYCCKQQPNMPQCQFLESLFLVLKTSSQQASIGKPAWMFQTPPSIAYSFPYIFLQSIPELTHFYKELTSDRANIWDTHSPVFQGKPKYVELASILG